MPTPGHRRLRVLNTPRPPGSRGYAAPAWLALVRVYVQLEKALGAALEPHGLTLSHFDILATLHHGDAITQQELAERLLVTKGAVCVSLDRLESAGWVERRADAADRRANRLHLTAAGRAVLAAVWPVHDALLRRAMAPLDEPQRRQLYELLSQVESALED